VGPRLAPGSLSGLWGFVRRSPGRASPLHTALKSPGRNGDFQTWNLPNQAHPAAVTASCPVFVGDGSDGLRRKLILTSESRPSVRVISEGRRILITKDPTTELIAQQTIRFRSPFNILVDKFYHSALRVHHYADHSFT
jgi:hypothetical protein